MKKSLIISLVICTFSVCAQGSFTFNDIEFWAGSGANEAAFVVDWHSQCLVWGYRWDGSATGEDMLKAVCAADSRLYAMAYYTGPGLGSAMGGIGYDADNDGIYGITNGTTTFNQNNIVGGFIATNDYDFDSWTSTDSGDKWFSGWYNGYWSYWLGTSDSDWDYSGVGMSSRVLTNGSWDGWSWADFAQYGFGSSPENLQAAPIPEPATMVLFGLGSALSLRKRK